jgi:hypothetical protein
MTLDASGNLLVGRTSAITSLSTGSQAVSISASASNRVGILELNGTRTTDGNDCGYVRFYNNAGATPVADITALRGSSDTTGTLTFSTSNAERARIDSSGNFGVGTNNPVAKFDLAGDYKEGVVTANTGTAYTINTATGTVQILTLTGNCTFTFPTAVAGESFTLLLRQDGTGSRTVTWPAAVRWPGSTAPTITATANQTDKYVFTSDGTRWYGSNAGQAYAA